jgi:hypothetical protein
MHATARTLRVLRWVQQRVKRRTGDAGLGRKVAHRETSPSDLVWGVCA